MLAIALSIALFLFWSVIGYALVTTLHASRSRVQDVLLSPAVGLAAFVIPLFSLNRFGVPISRLGIPLAVGLLLAAGVLLWWRNPGFPWKRVWPFAVILALALVAIGRPMLKFGFDWVSFCNDDMANYALAGDRVYHSGYMTPPNSEDVVRGHYFGGDFWFMHVAVRARPGCEMTLAWVTSVTGLNEHQAFMPLIFSFHLALLTAASALVAAVDARGRDREREPGEIGDISPEPPEPVEGGWSRRLNWHAARLLTPALLACAMMGVSALITLGTVYQLIAQVSGLMLLAVCAALLLRPFNGVRGWTLVRHGALVGIVGAGLMIIYPEVAPFLGPAFLGYVVIGLVRRRLAPLPMVAAMAVAVVVAAVLMRKYFADSIQYILVQTRSATVQTGNVHTVDPKATLFPYYMMPEGLGDLWGFLRIALWEQEPYLSIFIGAGAFMLLVATVATVWLCWRGRPEAFVTAGMLAMGLMLFRQRAGFGLYKLAMYLQPFVIPTLVVAWLTLIRPRKADAPASFLMTIVRVLPLFVIAVVGTRAQRLYVDASEGTGQAFMEMQDPSRTRLVGEFRRIVDAHPNAPLIISDTYNIVVAKFQALYTKGRELVFPSRAFFQIIDYAAETKWVYLDPTRAEMAQRLVDDRKQQLLIKAQFDLMDPDRPGMTNTFYQTDLGHTAEGKGGDALFIKTAPRQSIVNRRHFDPGYAGNFMAVPYNEVRNHLIFVASQLGPPYYEHGSGDVHPAFYQLEPDPLFFPTDTLAAVGRYLLIQTINPAEKVRVSISATFSYQSDGKNELPPVTVIGKERVKLPLSGRGSMRTFSPPVEPQVINGRRYLMIDMGTPGRQFTNKRSGLMNMYGTDIWLDRRVIVGFARDISIVSEEQYLAMRRPNRADGFPTDSDPKQKLLTAALKSGRDNPLRNRDLEYTGMYEDGWTSEDVAMTLAPPPGGVGNVVAHGVIPEMGNNAVHRTRIVLSVDGQTVAEADAGLGEFVVRGPIPPVLPGGHGHLRKVRVQFVGPTFQLPAGDDRVVTGQLLSLGFEAPAAVQSSPAGG